jgi:hypothetical protein
MTFPTALAITSAVVALLIFVGRELILDALHHKGDVRATLSHGRTTFKLEAKERLSPNKGLRSRNLETRTPGMNKPGS